MLDLICPFFLAFLISVLGRIFPTLVCSPIHGAKVEWPTDVQYGFVRDFTICETRYYYCYYYLFYFIFFENVLYIANIYKGLLLASFLLYSPFFII